MKKVRLKTVPVNVFKANSLRFIDRVQETSQPVILTRSGKPVAKIVPIAPAVDDLFGFMKGKMEIVGDIVSPVFSEEEWELLR